MVHAGRHWKPRDGRAGGPGGACLPVPTGPLAAILSGHIHPSKARAGANSRGFSNLADEHLADGWATERGRSEGRVGAAGVPATPHNGCRLFPPRRHLRLLPLRCCWTVPHLVGASPGGSIWQTVIVPNLSSSAAAALLGRAKGHQGPAAAAVSRAASEQAG